MIHTETYLFTACALRFLHVQTRILLALHVPIHRHTVNSTQTIHRHEEVHKHTIVHRVHVAEFLKWPLFYVLICLKLSKH